MLMDIVILGNLWVIQGTLIKMSMQMITQRDILIQQTLVMALKVQLNLNYKERLMLGILNNSNI